MKTKLTLAALALAGAAALPAAASETILHRFRAPADGATPQAPLVADPAGVLYGATWGGGTNDLGSVYSVQLDADGSIRETVLYSFAGGTDGARAQSALILDAAGNLYGTTSSGGANGDGVVYELIKPATPDGVWQEKILHTFGNDDGVAPHGALVFGRDGALYGTAFFGGTGDSGTVFRLVPQADGSWTGETLYSFTGGADGWAPLCTLVFDRAGNLYGTALGGGSVGQGVVFELSPGPAGAPWRQTVLYNFDGPGDGGQPQTGVVFDRAGNLYGTTVVGGTGNSGNVFKLTPPAQAGQAWTETILHPFAFNVEGTPGLSLPLLEAGGKLLGTSAGGTQHLGEIWELAPPADGGSDWTLTDLYDFSGGADGSGPGGGVVKLKGGRYAGVTEEGGSQRTTGNGTVYLFKR